jgi:pyruvate dehydrogenase (quinone)
MSKTASDFLLTRLSEWGVTHVYGFPGDGINGILGAFERQDRIKFVQTRHEEMAAFMACAHAKFTGDVGVCMATSGPGAIHLLNGLYDAKLDHAPVVAIVGQAPSYALGSSTQQEVDLPNLFKDVAAAYVEQASDASQLRHLVDRAIRIAKSERTVTAVIIPGDIQEKEAIPQQPHKSKTVHSGVGWSEPKIVPTEYDLQRAADVLNAGKKVAVLVGQGALHATDEVVAVADTLGAGIAKALLGKAAVPDDIPYCTNSIGLLGTKPSWDMMQGCDTLLMIGSAFPYAEFLPKEGQCRGVQIDIKGRQQSLRYPMEVVLTGDSKHTLQALLPMLKRQTERGWQEKIVEEVESWRRLMDHQADDALTVDGILKPQPLFKALSEHLPDRAILSADSGSGATWYARYLKIRRGMKATLSGNLATMLPGVPYAIAAKFAYPDRASVAIVGDGAMQMLGMNELLTAQKYYKEWADPTLVFLVLNNKDLNMVTWEQRVLAGDPKFEASQDIPFVDFAKFADLIGLRGIHVERPEEIGPAMDEAFSADRPVVIDAMVDPNEPPLPPHITIEQAKAFASAIVKGDPDSLSIAAQSLKEKIDEFIPGR